VNPSAADDLTSTRAAFDAWRAQRPHGTRIPEELWARAVALVAEHGELSATEYS
jgi:hypothetical protein